MVIHMGKEWHMNNTQTHSNKILHHESDSIFPQSGSIDELNRL